ncbi:hypothetical protein Tco_0922235 [Tanacetum coccineum]|uniref:Transposase (Putative), gypsy type n=1 Tax=Tanacetum coccineum TaxID=301880 RepID=A0ABQ5D0U5_9ASTR
MLRLAYQLHLRFLVPSELEVSVDKLFDEGVVSEQVEQGLTPLDPSGPSIAGKFRSAVHRLLAGAVLNAEGSERFVISSDSPHHSTANIAEAKVDSIVRSSTLIIATVVTATVDAAATVKPSLFGVGSSSAGGTDPTPGGFSDVSGSDFLIGGIRTVVEPDFDLQKVYVPQWSVTNGSRLDDGHVCRQMLDEFAPLKFFAYIRGMEHDQLFTEFNVGAARQVSFSAEGEVVDSLERMESLKECNTTLEKEKSVLDVRVSDLAATVKVREQEAADSNAMVTAVKLQNDKLADQVHYLESVMVGDKLAKLEVDLVYVGKFFEYLSGFRTLPSSRAIEMGMQDVLAAGIKMGAMVDVMEDLVAFYPSAEEGFIMPLCRSSVIAACDANGVTKLMVPIHRSEDQAVLGSTSLSFALSVSHDKVERIRKNIAEHRSALAGVYVPLVEPLSVQNLTGAAGTSDVLPTAVATITALSTTFASAITVLSVSVDDYIITDEENVQPNV